MTIGHFFDLDYQSDRTRKLNAKMSLVANWRSLGATNGTSALTAGNNLVNSLGNSLSSSSSNGSLGSSPSPLSSSFSQLHHHQLAQHFTHQLNQFNAGHHAFTTAASAQNCTPTLGGGPSSAFHQLNSSSAISTTDSQSANLNGLSGHQTNPTSTSTSTTNLADSTLPGLNMLNSDFLANSNASSTLSSLTPLQQQQLILHHQQAVAAAHAQFQHNQLHSNLNANSMNTVNSSTSVSQANTSSSSHQSNATSSSNNSNNVLSSSNSNVDSKLQQLQQLGCPGNNVTTVTAQQLIECVVCSDKSSGKHYGVSTCKCCTISLTLSHSKTINNPFLFFADRRRMQELL